MFRLILLLLVLLLLLLILPTGPMVSVPAIILLPVLFVAALLGGPLELTGVSVLGVIFPGVKKPGVILPDEKSETPCDQSTGVLRFWNG